MGVAFVLGALTFVSVFGLVVAVGAIRSARAARPSERLRRYAEATSVAGTGVVTAPGTGGTAGARTRGPGRARGAPRGRIGSVPGAPGRLPGREPGTGAAKGAARRAGVSLGPIRGLLTSVGRLFEAKTYSKALEEELAKADIALRGSEFMALGIFTVSAGALIGSVVGKRNPLFLLLSVLIGAASPWLWVRSAQRQRLGKVNSQLADSLVIISNSLRAGYSFLQSLDMVSHEMPTPIATEYGRVLKEMNLGAVAEQALTNFYKRVPTDDIDLVVTAVLIQRQVGGNLSEILDKISFTIRERVRIKGQIRTLTAMGRLSGLIVALLPVGLAVMLMGLNPSYMRLLFTHPLGRIMVGVGIMGEILGAYVINRIVKIDV